MMLRRLWGWLHGGRESERVSGLEAQAATESADASRVQAEEDWLDAMECRVEADSLTRTLRAHNAANRYDDWILGIVRR